MPLYLNYPSWIHPEIFPGVPVLGLIRWYGLMYIFAFGTAYLVLKRLMKEGALNTSDYTANEDDLFSFIATGIIFLLIGQTAVLYQKSTDTLMSVSAFLVCKLWHTKRAVQNEPP